MQTIFKHTAQTGQHPMPNLATMRLYILIHFIVMATNDSADQRRRALPSSGQPSTSIIFPRVPTT